MTTEHRRVSPCCDDEARRYLSTSPTAELTAKLAKAGAAFLAAAQLEGMTKAPDYIRKKRAFRKALADFEAAK